MEPVVPNAVHRLEVNELGTALGTDLSLGLASAEVESRLKRYGRNQLVEKPPPSWWTKLVSQFSDLVIWILLTATALSAAMGEWLEAGAIFAIVLLNGLLGFIQEQRAEKALLSLRKLSAPTAKVIRDGLRRNIAAGDLVPGDIVELESGDHVPADVRLVKSYGLKTQEAPLTGESLPIDKNEAALKSGNPAIADRTNTVYLGTTVVAGKAVGAVAATGMSTELGRIAGFLQNEKAEETPLQKRLAELGRVLILACFSLVAIIFLYFSCSEGSIWPAHSLWPLVWR